MEKYFFSHKKYYYNDEDTDKNVMIHLEKSRFIYKNQQLYTIHVSC